MRIAAAILFTASACNPEGPTEPPAAVFILGALQGEAHWIGKPEHRPGIRLVFRNVGEEPVYWRGVPACASEGWSQPPQDAEARTWYGDHLMRIGCTFEDATPFPSPNAAVWRLLPGAYRELTIRPFREFTGGPADGFESWEYEVGVCLTSDQPPQHALDYQRANLRLRWTRAEGMSVTLTE